MEKGTPMARTYFRDALGRFANPDAERALQIAQYAGWQSVDSSCVAAVKWQSETMDVRFQNGYSYSYFGVPVSVFEEFLSSGSKGGFLNSAIKPNYS